MKTQTHTIEFKSMSVSAIAQVEEENNTFKPFYKINGVGRHINRDCDDIRDAYILAMVAILNNLKKHNKTIDASIMYAYAETYAIQNNRLHMLNEEISNNLVK